MKIEERVPNSDPPALRLVKGAPELNGRERREINGLFPAYIFRVQRKRELWTTCCGKYRRIPKGEETEGEYAVLEAEHTPEPKFSFGRQLNRTPPSVPCPYCGQEVQVKEMGRTGSRVNLSSYRRAVVLRWYRGALWATAWECAKHYTRDGECLCDLPQMGFVGAYRFRPGLAEQAVRRYDRWIGCYSAFSFHVQAAPMRGGKWNLTTQFSYTTDNGMHYDTLGLEAVERSPLRWCCAAEYHAHHCGTLNFLTAACVYPRQVEMLMKAGMEDVVWDLAERGKKHSHSFKWEETDPVKAFGLDRQEMRQFLATERKIDTVAVYKKMKKRGESLSMAEADDIRGSFRDPAELFAAADKWGVAPMRLWRYLSRENRSPQAAFYAWRDYVDQAEKLGYALHRDNVLLPSPLGEAHDETAEAYRRHLERQRKKEEKKKKAELQELLARRGEKYDLEADGWIIRCAENAREICEEGRVLKHCVAGYAERHMSGTTTILFMRPAAEPDKPHLTIEMRGDTLIQIHGYRNEGLYSQNGRFAPDPREVHREFLDRWLKWIQNGSKRREDGSPILPKMKKEAKTA